MTYLVVSLDGGGIRGCFTAQILKRLSEAAPLFLDRIRLVAGTSTGGILALGLAAGLTPDQLVALYRDRAGEIFYDTLLDDLLDLGGLTGADYGSRGLGRVAHETFGAKSLGDLGKRVLISSFDLDAGSGANRGWKPKFFHNYPGPDSDSHWLARDVALATSAAPTYFPTYKGFADGGLVANNPSMCALAQAVCPKAGKQRLEDVALLSIGTGTRSHFVEGDTLDWGLVKWAPHLLNVLMDGPSDVAHFQCDRMLGRGRYMRVQVRLARDIPLDATDAGPELIELANKVDLGPALAWLRPHLESATA